MGARKWKKRAQGALFYIRDLARFGGASLCHLKSGDYEP